MSSTPSPSKRPRIPTTSATASPFAPPRGPKSVGPSSSALVGMSPDNFSPAAGTVDAYSGYTPYSTTSPAYAANGSAASPLSTALAHGSRILSNIGASPFPLGGHTPITPQHFARFPAQTAQQHVQTRVQHRPQQGSPEHLRAALQHLQTTLLARLESESEAFFDAAEGAAGIASDARMVKGKAEGLLTAMDDVLGWLEKNGLASLPLLPLPESNTAPDAPDAASTTVAPTAAVEPADTMTQDNTSATAAATTTSAATTQSAEELTLDLTSRIDSLQKQARELFDRRQRLKESASIVGGILDS